MTAIPGLLKPKTRITPSSYVLVSTDIRRREYNRTLDNTKRIAIIILSIIPRKRAEY